jgi:hypothetical protein
LPTDQSFIQDDDVEAAASSPLQDEVAWGILEEYLTTDMSFPDMEVKLASHLGTRYREEDWAEARTALFSGDEDNSLSLTNLLAIKARHLSSPVKVPRPSSVSNLQRGRSWKSTVDSISQRYSAASGSSQVSAPPQAIPSVDADMESATPSSLTGTETIERSEVPGLPTWLVTVPCQYIISPLSIFIFL